MLPLAALRLKQGFGRLIRSRSDRGVVVILDRRARERGYGRYLLDSLAPSPVLMGPWAEVREQLRAFYLRVDSAATHPFPQVSARQGEDTPFQPATARDP
jgi:hypothetical protein